MTVANPSSRRALLRTAAALPLLGFGAGCQLPGSSPAPREFRVTAETTFADDLPEVDWSLAVDRPTILTAIDSARIARLSGVEVEYYAGAAWVDRPAPMIEPLLIASFRNSGAIEVVVDRRSEVRPDFLLQTNLAAFQAEPNESGPPVARVVISATLVNMPQREVVGTTELGRTIAAQAGDPAAVAAAIDEALGQVLKELVEWTLTTGQTAVEGS
jgi:cholesterol transport system auxiliary component